MNAARGNGTGEGAGCPVAHVALSRADDALDANRTVYEALGRLAGEMAGLKGEMREGFRVMGERIRDARRDAHKAIEGVEELEDTKVRDLRAELKAANRTMAGWRAWGLRVLAGVIVGVVVALIVTAIRAHK